MTRAYNTATTQQNSGGAVNPFVAGKNKIINGDFGIWQRGTSFSSSGQMTADRWKWAGGSGTVSRQAFTLGTAPVSGYEGQYYLNWTLTGNSQNIELQQNIEDARTFAGQTVTLSFWARSTVGAQAQNAYIYQNFGTGGSPSSMISAGGTSYTPTASWQRFSFTINMPSVAGKTFGTNNDSYLWVRVAQMTTTATNTSIDIWGVQLEAGSTATGFTTATGNPQGELAACQRYYQRKTSVGNGTLFGMGQCQNTTNAYYLIPIPVVFRVAPSVAHSGVVGWTSSTGNPGGTIAVFLPSANSVSLQITGGAGLVAGNASGLAGSTSSSYLELSAEL